MNKLGMSLTPQQKKDVFRLIESWQKNRKLCSVRDSNLEVPRTLISLVANAAGLAAEEKDRFAKKKRAYELIEKLMKTSFLSSGTRKEAPAFIKNIVQDPVIRQMSYEQMMFFLYSLRRLTKNPG